MKNVLFGLLVVVSMFFLFINPNPILLNSQFMFYSASGVSMLVVLSFFFFFRTVFMESLTKQLKSMQETTSNGWIVWFAENICECTTILWMGTPYIIGLSAVANGVSNWFPEISVITTISLGTMITYSGLMVFLMLTVTFNWVFNRKKPESYSITK